MSAKDLVKDYFRFSKKDRLGGLIILVILAAVYLIPFIIPRRNAAEAIVPNNLLKEVIDTLERSGKQGFQYGDGDERGTATSYQPQKEFSSSRGELFAFDPNTLSAKGWQQLGLSGRTAATIVKYRSKGGKFYKPEDLKKIWGLPKGFYERVEAYIKLEANERPAERGAYPARESTHRQKTVASISNLNTADTSALIALPGIGQKLAARIVAFRDRLGGFTSVEQVRETYGLSDSTFQVIKPFLTVDPTAVRKLNLNTCTREELKAHPYFKWNLANAVIAYREQHGSFTSIEDLKKIILIDEATYQKIKGYVTL